MSDQELGATKNWLFKPSGDAQHIPEEYLEPTPHDHDA